MDIQSRPNNLSKYEVLKTFDSLENLKEDFTEKNLKEKFKNGKELLEYLGEKLRSIRVYCNNCKIKDYCQDSYFETETKKKFYDKEKR